MVSGPTAICMSPTTSMTRFNRYDGNTGAFIDIFVASGSGGLGWPEDLVFGPDGNLYVGSDVSFKGILRYDGATGAFIDIFVAAWSGGLQSAQGLEFGPDGHLYVGSWDEDAVNRYNGTTGAYIDKYVTGGPRRTVANNRPRLHPRTTGHRPRPHTLLGGASELQCRRSADHGKHPHHHRARDDGTITAANDLRIRIPDSFNMVWDTSVTSVTLGGAASGKVSATLLAYEDGAKTAVIDVTSDFAAGDVLTLADLAFTSFSASSAGRLTLEILNDGRTTAIDDKTITIVGSPLTGVSNAPSPDTVSDTSTHTVSFTTADPLPLDGKIVVTFPAGFDLTAVGNGDISSGTMDGNFTVGAAGQVLTITRSLGSPQPAAAENIFIANITNTSTGGTGYTVTVATQDSSGTPINGPTASSAFTVQGKLALANPDIRSRISWVARPAASPPMWPWSDSS